jgi:hypothetical protein
MADSILLLKSALEFARFVDPVLRQRVYDTIDRLDQDLQAHDFTFDTVLDDTFEALEEQVKACEEVDETEINAEEVEEVEVVEAEDNEDTEELTGENDDDVESLDETED